MKVGGFGQYPTIDASIHAPHTKDALCHALKTQKTLIPRGLGRSYGDSSLAHDIVETRYFQHFHAFDARTGMLTCDAGLSLDEILSLIVPQGWFLPVTPGTRFVTVGGAIASDVHGKNHHQAGTFTEHVTQLELLLGNGECVTVSPTQQADLFHATCGGMGLTGMILSASIQLKPIQSSRIKQTTIKCTSLQHVLAAFDEHQHATYSVAWIDSLAKGKALGRSILTLGEHATDGVFKPISKKAIAIPFTLPISPLNKASIKSFNQYYYHKVLSRSSIRRVNYDAFFYPLDGILHWNRLYGKTGFVQYQCVLPKSGGNKSLHELLELIVKSGEPSFLAVLKLLGKSNLNYLSFPAEGYTLALDFKATSRVFSLLKKLDERVLHYGGRLYLAKDARMSADLFKATYPNWEQFQSVREKYHAINKFTSQQSIRLGLQ